MQGAQTLQRGVVRQQQVGHDPGAALGVTIMDGGPRAVTAASTESSGTWATEAPTCPGGVPQPFDAGTSPARDDCCYGLRLSVPDAPNRSRHVPVYRAWQG